jgi:hypothetical protein
MKPTEQSRAEQAPGTTRRPLPTLGRGGDCSRRDVLAGSAALVAGGLLGGAATAYAAGAARADSAPLPWKWATLDPLEAGRRAYRFYKERGGCGSGSYLSLLSLLREEVGHPWTTLPDMMMIHAGAGYGGHGTLCGTLGGSSLIINLVTYDDRDPANYAFGQIIDRLFWWYAEQEFPTDRFDDLSPIPGQVKVKAMTPLCHTSVSKWVRAAGADIRSAAKIERCAKVAGEVVYAVTTSLNEYFAGTWTPPVWKPSAEIEHCVTCHSPDTVGHTGGMNTQQGHMECLLCHDDHMKAGA